MLLVRTHLLHEELGTPVDGPDDKREGPEGEVGRHHAQQV